MTSKLTIATCFHERPLIARMFCEQIQRLKKEYPINCVVAVSDMYSAKLCIEYNIQFVCVQNKPLGNKWNAAVEAATNTNCEYVMIIGDDDFFNQELLDLYIPFMEKGTPYFGVDSIYFLDAKTKQANVFTYYRSRLIGAGRCIARWVLQKYGYQYPIEYSKKVRTRELKAKQGQVKYLPMDLAEYQNGVGYGVLCGQEKFLLFDSELDRGLDNSCEMYLSSCGIVPLQLKTTMPLITDIKTGTNISSHEAISVNDNIVGVATYEEATRFLGTREMDILKTI